MEFSLRIKQGGAAMAKSYYQIIDGNRYDREMLTIAQSDTQVAKGGTLGQKVADQLFEAIIDGYQYTKIEKATLEYIGKTYSFNQAAKKSLDKNIKNWELLSLKERREFPEKKKPVKEPSTASTNTENVIQDSQADKPKKVNKTNHIIKKEGRVENKDSPITEENKAIVIKTEIYPAPNKEPLSPPPLSGSDEYLYVGVVVLLFSIFLLLFLYKRTREGNRSDH